MKINIGIIIKYYEKFITDLYNDYKEFWKSEDKVIGNSVEHILSFIKQRFPEYDVDDLEPIHRFPFYMIASIIDAMMYVNNYKNICRNVIVYNLTSDRDTRSLLLNAYETN